MTLQERPSSNRITDFDFLVGQWTVFNERLLAPLTGSEEWRESRARAKSQTFFNGAVSIDEMVFDGFSGMSVRLFAPATGAWTIYWVNSQTGNLQAPVTGSWADGVLTAVGSDEFEGRPILASYRWSGITPLSARWEQAFSIDGGLAWETNWIMRWRRVGPRPT